MGCQQSRAITPIASPIGDLDLQPPRPQTTTGRSRTKRKHDIFDINDPLVAKVDERARNVPQELLVEPLNDLVAYLTEEIEMSGGIKHRLSDLYKVRAMFTWLASINVGGLLLDWVPPENCALSMIWDIKQSMKSGNTTTYSNGQKKRNHAYLFSIMCQVASIKECMIVNGITKSSNYFPGDESLESRSDLRSQWNVVNIDGEMRLIDILWSSTCIVGKMAGFWTRTLNNNNNTDSSSKDDILPSKGNIQHQINEYYFLTDPDQLIYTHFPDDTRWEQLTDETQWHLQRFSESAFVKEMYFHLGMKAKKNKGNTNTMQADEDGEIVIEYRLPSDTSVDMKFKGMLLREKATAAVSAVDHRNLPLASTDRYIMVELTKEMLRYTISFPVNGTFKFDVYGNYSGQNELKPEIFSPKRKKTRLRTSPSDLEAQEPHDSDDEEDDDEIVGSKKLFLVASYRIHCPSEKIPCFPTPISSDFGWGNNLRLQSWDLSIKSQDQMGAKLHADKRGEINIEITSKDPRIELEYEVWAMREGQPRLLSLSGLDKAKAVAHYDSYLIRLLVHITDDPEDFPAEYGLKIIASSESRDNENVLNYKVDWAEKEEIEIPPSPDIDWLVSGQIVQNTELDSLKTQLLEFMAQDLLDEASIKDVLASLSWKYPDQYESDDEIVKARKDFDIFVKDKERFDMKRRLQAARSRGDDEQLQKILDEIKELFPDMLADDFIKMEAHYLTVKSDMMSAFEQRKLSQVKRSVRDAEKNKFQERLGDLFREAKILMETLQHLEDLKNSVLKLDSSVMAEIKNMRVPKHEIHEVMRVVLLILGDTEDITEDWSGCQKQLRGTGKRGLQRRITEFDVEKFHPEIAARAKEILIPMKQDQVRTASLGAEAFYTWAMGMIKANENQYSDKDYEPANVDRQHEIFHGSRPKHEGDRRASNATNEARRMSRVEHTMDVHFENETKRGRSTSTTSNVFLPVPKEDASVRAWSGISEHSALESVTETHKSRSSLSDEESQAELHNSEDITSDSPTKSSEVQENNTEMVSSTQNAQNVQSPSPQTLQEDDGNSNNDSEDNHLNQAVDRPETSKWSDDDHSDDPTIGAVKVDNGEDDINLDTSELNNADGYSDDFELSSRRNTRTSRDWSSNATPNTRRFSHITDDLELE